MPDFCRFTDFFHFRNLSFYILDPEAREAGDIQAITWNMSGV